MTNPKGKLVVSRTKSIRSSSSATGRTASISAEAAKPSASGNGGHGDSSHSYFGVLFQRLAMSLGIVYVVTEYGIEWTVCEGPSMMPTIKPRGEIVLIDRFTPQLWGLHGGDSVSKRTVFARRSQEKHVEEMKRKKKKKRELLLRLYLKEEERMSQGKNETKDVQPNQKSVGSIGKENTQEIEKKEIETIQQIPRSLVTPKPALTSIEAIKSNKSREEKLQDLREALEQMGDDDDEETWYETRIPVNKLPPEGSWSRFWTQITTGISVGDVVVLQHPDRIGTVCKRVMGLPGDIVTKPSSRLGAERLDALLYGGTTSRSSTPQSLESEDERRRRNRRNKRRLLSNGITVPDGHIWVEGDNPWNSSDSRNYGAVPAALIMGRVLCRLWPLRGKALMERGDRPVRSNDEELSLAFSGSIVIPVGWEEQRIVREHVPVSAPVVLAQTETSQREQEK